MSRDAIDISGRPPIRKVTFYNGTKPPDSARTAAAARGELAAATDALVVAKNARTILDDKVKDAKSALGFANDRAKKAAVRVIAAERLEPLLAETAEARATYLEGVSQLAWLIQQHAVPTSDARARQLVAGADTPPSAWREAPSAGTGAMGAAGHRVDGRSGGRAIVDEPVGHVGDMVYSAPYLKRLLQGKA